MPKKKVTYSKETVTDLKNEAVLDGAGPSQVAVLPGLGRHHSRRLSRPRPPDPGTSTFSTQDLHSIINLII